jgi:hypothetical protein
MGTAFVSIADMEKKAMQLCTEILKADGFNDTEIRQIEDYCNAAEHAGTVNRQGAVVWLNDAERFVIRTIAEIMDQLRPGCWLDRHAEDETSPDECPCCGEHAKCLPEDEATREQWSAFEQKLLAVGGTRVVWRGAEDDLDQLLARGRLFEQPVKFLNMPVNRCHENAAIVWGKDVENTQLVYGYALYADGLWRQHSWCVQDGTLLETNVAAEKYFGIVLSQKAALKSWVCNFAAQRYRIGSPAMQRCMRDFPQVVALTRKLEKQHRKRRRHSLRALFNK